MTPEHFIQWLADMKAAGLCSSDKEAGELLGVSDQAILNWKRDGTTKRQTDLACRALLHRMNPYPE